MFNVHFSVSPSYLKPFKQQPPETSIQYPLPSNQRTDDRSQRTEVRYSGIKSSYSTRHALFALLYALFHNSQLLSEVRKQITDTGNQISWINHSHNPFDPPLHFPLSDVLLYALCPFCQHPLPNTQYPAPSNPYPAPVPSTQLFSRREQSCRPNKKNNNHN
jgi:hypothetical protein